MKVIQVLFLLLKTNKNGAAVNFKIAEKAKLMKRQDLELT
jgi:hypothetical protein